MKRLFILLFLLLPMTYTWGVNMPSLYEADLPISAQTDEMKEEAVGKGFMQVLFKLSGNPEIYENPTIKASLKRANYYVLEYSYSQATTAASEFMIHIKYHPDDINRLLKNAQVSYWGQVRPLILTWLLYTPYSGDPEVIGSDSKLFLAELLKFQSKKFGLPLIFPVMDVTDLALISPKEIAGMDYPTLNQAGMRYEPDAILIGIVEETERGFQSQWHFALGTETWDWAISDKILKNAIKTLLSQTSETLARYYVESNPRNVSLKVEIDNVDEREALDEVNKFLNIVTSVQQVQLNQVAGPKALFTVDIFGTIDNFEKNAAIGHHLILKSKNLSENKLVYDWIN